MKNFFFLNLKDSFVSQSRLYSFKIFIHDIISQRDFSKASKKASKKIAY